MFMFGCAHASHNFWFIRNLESKLTIPEPSWKMSSFLTSISKSCAIPISVIRDANQE
jgi:hypothetical protein